MILNYYFNKSFCLETRRLQHGDKDDTRNYCIKCALEWLMKNNVLYKSIVLDEIILKEIVSDKFALAEKQFSSGHTESQDASEIDRNLKTNCILDEDALQESANLNL